MPRLTPYQRHNQLKHNITHYSPNGADIIDERLTCGSRFLHNPSIGYPVSMPSLCTGCYHHPCTCKDDDWNFDND